MKCRLQKSKWKVKGTLQTTDVGQVAARAAIAAMGEEAMCAAGWGTRPPRRGAAYMLPLCHESERFEVTLDPVRSNRSNIAYAHNQKGITC